MRKFITVLALLVTISAISQDLKEEAPKAKTEMELFTSKAGEISKLADYNLSKLKGQYSTFAITRVRKIFDSSVDLYFYQIKFGNSVASFDYLNLEEVIKAFKALRSEVSYDVSLNPDYLLNRYSRDDGFELGYFVKEGKANWYLSTDGFNSNTLYFKDLNSVLLCFLEGKDKLEKLKGLK